MFSKFAKYMSAKLGNPYAFLGSLAVIVFWTLLGPLFKYNDSWQLIINTVTNIVTFLMVFLIQNTQNRGAIATQLKLDEIIRAMEGAHNELLKIEKLSDEELQILHERYEKLALRVKEGIKQGKEDIGSPEI